MIRKSLPPSSKSPVPNNKPSLPSFDEAVDDLEHRRNSSRHTDGEFYRGYAWGIYQGVHSLIGGLEKDGILSRAEAKKIRGRFLA